MSSRKIRYKKSDGSIVTEKFSFNKNKKYKFNKSTGAVEEYTGTAAADEITIPGSKSSLRRLAEVERNISILASKSGVAGSSNADTGVLLKTEKAADSDKLDGLNSTQFLRSDAADTWTGTLTWGGVGGGTALQLTNGDIHGVNKLHINDHGEGIHFGGSSVNPTLYSPDATHLKLDTNSGFLQFGAMNASWCHFQTDRPNFYFNKGAAFDGSIRGYTGDEQATFAQFNVRPLTNGVGAKVTFSDHAGGSYAQNGTMEYVHSDTNSYGSGNAFKFYGTEPSLSFHVAGTGLFTGDVTAYYSDERLKDFSGKIENALDKVNALNGYHYTGNAAAGELGYDTEVQQVGVSAQEVQAVLPEVVKSAPINDDAGTDYMTVQYERLAPLFIEAMKEMSAKIESLEAELAELKK